MHHISINNFWIVSTIGYYAFLDLITSHCSSLPGDFVIQLRYLSNARITYRNIFAIDLAFFKDPNQQIDLSVAIFRNSFLFFSSPPPFYPLTDRSLLQHARI